MFSVTSKNCIHPIHALIMYWHSMHANQNTNPYSQYVFKNKPLKATSFYSLSTLRSMKSCAIDP